MHLSRKEIKKRLKKYAADDLDAWRVRPEDWLQEKRYDEYTALAEEMLAFTSTGYAPWTVVEGDCPRWARVKVLTQTAATITQALDRLKIEVLPPPVLPPQTELLPTEPDYLAKVDLSLKLDPEAYKRRIREVQVELLRLQRQIFEHAIPVLLIFEGWDAAGKGGAIKRVTDTLDPRSYKVSTFAAPSREENQYHYLWRFWQHIPEAGTIGIFDRSWYGRVLVERVEGFASEANWRQSYQEINEFEAQLTNYGVVLVKFWLHISPKEQLKRFEERQADPFKVHKITEEDWRNREKWNLYAVAVNQVVARTSTPAAPWALIPGDNKYYARVKVLETVIEAVKAELKRRA
jgi:polyphosphate:AMP phosphotransferase